jgi:hypothetical protein
MNNRDIFDTRGGAEGILGRLISRFTSGAIINIVIFLFVAGILLMTFLYVGLIFLKNL